MDRSQNQETIPRHRRPTVKLPWWKARMKLFQITICPDCCVANHDQIASVVKGSKDNFGKCQNCGAIGNVGIVNVYDMERETNE